MEKNPLIRLFRRFTGRGTGVVAAGPDKGGVRVASAKDVEEGKPFCADVGGTEIALFKVKDGYAAIDNVCPHLGGPLCKGTAENGVVTCPWHGSQFSIQTGAVMKGPAKAGVRTYPVEVRSGDLYVSVTPDVRGKNAQPVTFAFQEILDKERPFAYGPFVDDLLDGMRFPFKLYGPLKLLPIAQDPDELDLHLGEVHVTEMDLQKLSALMSAMNAKWGTSITFCLFHSSRFPGAMLINIRGPKAPSNLAPDIGY